MLRVLRSLIIILMCQSLIFSPLVYADQLALPSGDLIAPQISHEPLKESVKAGSSQQVKATVTDNVGIKSVTLFYRQIGSEEYKRIQMNQIEGGDDFMAILGFEETKEPGIEYYIQAVDLAGNALLHGYSFSPLKIGVASEAATPATVADQAPDVSTTSAQAAKDEPLGKKKTKTWLWIGLGVLAVGIIAAVAGGGSDDGGTTQTGAGDETGKVSFTAPVPAP